MQLYMIRFYKGNIKTVKENIRLVGWIFKREVYDERCELEWELFHSYITDTEEKANIILDSFNNGSNNMVKAEKIILE